MSTINPSTFILLLVISGYISYELKNKHVTEFSMLLTLQLYLDSLFFYKNRHNSHPNIDFNFGIQPVTFMRDERGISFRAVPPQETTPSPHPDNTGLIFGKCIILKCSLYYIMKCSVVLDFLNSLQMTDIYTES